ncbi:hypothetical protein AALO_G00209560 [Alosa alosa]|uniref:Uncharacterized protein n=1 Tax=Alosa alosa TaxID=278164 RepID=A0AAV6FZT4_9TELE|nr:hypothetical protein AALO_G00209560 [Alosa alosa]
MCMRAPAVARLAGAPAPYAGDPGGVCVVHNFQGKLLLSEEPAPDPMGSAPMMSMPRVESPLEKYIASQNHIAFAEVT